MGQTGALKFQSAATVTDSGIDQSVIGMGTVVLAATITGGTATLDITGKAGGAQTSAVYAARLSSGATATSITASGLYRVDVRGLSTLTLTLSAVSGATVTVVGYADEIGGGLMPSTSAGLAVDTELPAATSIPSPNSTAIAGLTMPRILSMLEVVHANGLTNTTYLEGREGNTDAMNPASFIYLCTMAQNQLFDGTQMVRQRSNTSVTLLASAARTTTQTSADLTNYNARGIQVTLDMTNVAASPSVTLTINGKDPASGKYYLLLSGAAVTTAVTNTYTVYPGATVAANVSASNVLPYTFQIVVTANNANSGTYSVGYNLIV